MQSEKQKILIDFALDNGGKITTKEANHLLRYFYYSNHAHYVSEILTRLVKAGKLLRTQKGCYELNLINNSRHQVKTLPNQTQLNF